MITPKTTDVYVTTRIAAKMLNVSLRTIQLWVESGILGAWKTPGGHRKVSVNSVNTVLKQREVSLVKSDIQPAEIGNQESQHSDEFSILFVEDDEGLRKLFSYYFTNWKRSVQLEIAGNGFEGLISLGSKVPDVLITDLAMPGINGFDLIRHLVESKQFKNLAIAVITALTPEEFSDIKALKSDIQIFAKPLRFDELEAYLLPLIDSKLGISN